MHAACSARSVRFNMDQTRSSVAKMVFSICGGGNVYIVNGKIWAESISRSECVVFAIKDKVKTVMARVVKFGLGHYDIEFDECMDDSTAERLCSIIRSKYVESMKDYEKLVERDRASVLSVLDSIELKAEYGNFVSRITAHSLPDKIHAVFYAGVRKIRHCNFELKSPFGDNDNVILVMDDRGLSIASVISDVGKCRSISYCNFLPEEKVLMLRAGVNVEFDNIVESLKAKASLELEKSSSTFFEEVLDGF